MDITPQTVFPTLAPDNPSFVGGANGVFHCRDGNAVEVYGQCTAGAGLIYLCFWDGAAWFPMDIDATGNKALPVDNTKAPGGRFHTSWLVGDTGGRWVCVYVTGGATLDPLRIQKARL